ncbi:alpha/beta hydrolase family protein [Olleya aquimaris]|uniref:Pimeloyl-ACP methyl ester carboxylesterase n=1 Tax=Olleya aquimaris TaxID=639310 RepID=A0A327RP94_9FLAO|nr:alpha/beta hydrolase [Olleya aquimaris]RAJ17752.1 pimeloyl-ACP methyl ester carboxylesterase [Olleya aquimaris]
MILKNQILTRNKQKPIVFDLFFNKSSKSKPLVIFCHGYKGFKDWGAWDLVANTFKDHDLFFVKFNFSHNGGTVDQPIDFPDLDAFAENNYSKELKDVNDMLSFLCSKKNSYLNQIDTTNIILIGHSRGGGIATIKASEDNRVTKLITWASVSAFGQRTTTTGDLEQWKKDGVKYVLNGRTKQQMPHNYQFYLDFKANEDRLNIKKACKNIQIPHLIIHAKDDLTVTFKEAKALHNWSPNSQLIAITNSNHVFNTKHPWVKDTLPKSINSVIESSIAFILD